MNNTYQQHNLLLLIRLISCKININCKMWASKEKPKKCRAVLYQRIWSFKQQCLIINNKTSSVRGLFICTEIEKWCHPFYSLLSVMIV